ncbi:unnamed protein product [Owenia fusiformis]|uniref:Uncharacterized protein n=1 Tax=Owenia fusiformis TaxID=6347 RepID=A0A8J1TFF2_OWEFU|nr:unnamed protein product [Owenia fusiformis]
MQSSSVLYLGLVAVLLCSALTEARYAGERSALTDLLLARLMASEKRDLPSPQRDVEDSDLLKLLSDTLEKRISCTNQCEDEMANEDNAYNGDFDKCYKENCEK